MKRFLSDYVTRNLWFYIFSSIAIILMIASFCVPPMGIIDGSVLAASGEIFAFAALGAVIKAIDMGVKAKVQRGDTSLTVGDVDKESQQSNIESDEDY